MPWVISFIASWILFIALADWKNLKTYLWGGVLSLFLATLVDSGAQKLGLYEFSDLVLNWFGCSAFYKFGPIATMGILFAQNIPRGKWVQALYILAFTLFYAADEYLVILTHVARYIHWSILASIIVDLLTFTSLTWFTQTFLKPQAH